LSIIQETMEPVFLLPDELDYELYIRKRYNISNAREKTKLLGDILKREEKGYDSPPVGLLGKATIDSEILTCREKLSNIKKNIENIDPSASKSRLHHVRDRLGRLIDGAQSTTTDIEVNTLLDILEETWNSLEPSEGRKTTLSNNEGELLRNQKENSVEENLMEKMMKIPTSQLPPPICPNTSENCNQTNNEDKTEQANHVNPLPTSNQDPVQGLQTALGSILLEYLTARQPQQQRNPRPSPVSHWKFSYSGESGPLKLSEFLPKVEMHATADHLSDRDLLDSAVFLFEGEVARWWQSARGNYTSWGQVAKDLKTNFAAPEDDLQVQRKILDRRQSQDEPFCVYVADMQNFFSSLSFVLSEQQKLTFVKGNMLPFYIEHLALISVNTVQELIVYCGLLETTRQRLKQLQPPAQAVPLVTTNENQQPQVGTDEVLEISAQASNSNRESHSSSNNQNFDRRLFSNRTFRENQNYSSFRNSNRNNYPSNNAGRTGGFRYQSRYQNRSNFRNNFGRNRQTFRENQNFGSERDNFRRNDENRQQTERNQENSNHSSEVEINQCRNCRNYGHSSENCFSVPPSRNSEDRARNRTDRSSTQTSVTRSNNPFL
jgi:Retrotransposon gag protein